MGAAGPSARTVSGIGIGLRAELAASLFEEQPAEVSFVEVHPENYVRRGGKYRENLERARERWPVLTHGLTQCFLNEGRYEAGHLRELRAFLETLEAPFHSDHLCFGQAAHAFAHDLLPVPYAPAFIAHASDRIREMQDALGMPVAIENVSQYLIVPGSTMSEADFVCEVLERSGAGILLDVNNVYVNAKNHGFDARAFLDKIPPSRVRQIHIAGHLVRDDGLRIDTHGEAVCEDVYSLLEHALERVGPVPVLLERDGNFPSFDALVGEVRRLSAIYARATSKRGVT